MRRWIGLWVLIFLAGCARNEPTPPVPVLAPLDAGDALALVNSFEKVDCPNSRFSGPGVECGYLSVPRNRTIPDGENLKIFAMIIPATAEKVKPDPIVFLSYGGSTGYAFSYRNTVSDRDLVLVDPRGIGRSEPVLTCPGVQIAVSELTEQSLFAPETLQRVQKEQQSCYQLWLQQGVDLSLFSSSAITADLEDLRLALGYQQWNIYASGYAARVALLTMRDYPQSIRSLVIESPSAVLGEDLSGQAANIERVLDLFFDSCTSDPDCNLAFPGLKESFYEVVDQLNGAPRLVEVADLNAGRRYRVLVDGDRVIDILVRSVTSGNMMVLQEMPRTIYQLKSGKFDNLARLLGSMPGGSMGYSSSGVQWLVECAELLPQIPRDRVLQSMGGVDAHLSEYFSRRYTAVFNTCEVLKDLRPTLDLQQISASDLPTLILYGDRSLSSAPEWSKRIASHLSRSYQVEIKGGGSGSGFDRIRGDCTRSIVSAFFDDPQNKPGTTCAAELPEVPTWITLP